MPYITKKTPVARSTDTPLGKIMGYLAELLEYLKWENMALVIDGVFPDYFPFGNVQSWLIDVCRGLYDRIYQGAYNHGADRGNEINSQILGWVDTAKNQAFAKVSEAQDYIQTNLINPIKNQIDTVLTPRINQAMTRLSSIETSVNNAITQVNQLGTTVTGMDSQVKNFASQIEAQRTKLNEIIETTNSVASRLSDLQAFVNDLDRRLKAVEGKQNGILSFLKI